MEYQPQQGDYKVQAERSDIDPSYFYYHFWQYDDNEWNFLYKAPEVVMTVSPFTQNMNLTRGALQNLKKFYKTVIVS